MTPLSSERTGVLIVRAWMEGDAEERLRATVTFSLDMDRGEQTKTAAATPEQIHRALDVWLQSFLEASRAPTVTSE